MVDKPPIHNAPFWNVNLPLTSNGSEKCLPHMDNPCFQEQMLPYQHTNQHSVTADKPAVIGFDSQQPAMDRTNLAQQDDCNQGQLA